MSAIPARSPTPFEEVQQGLRALRKIQIEWSHLNAKNEADKATLASLRATATDYNNRTFHIRLPTDQPLQAAYQRLSYQRQAIVEKIVNDPQLFAMLWTVFNLAQEDF